MSTTAVTGVGRLFDLSIRTERVAWPLSVLVVPALLLVTAAALAPLYPDAAARDELASGSAANPVFRLLLGPLQDTSGTGPIAVWRIGMFALLLAAILAATTVTRNLRSAESTGRMELVRSAAVGVWAPMATAVATATACAVATGLLVGGTAIAIGVPAVASVFLGAQFVGAGLVGVGVAAVVDQVVTTGRAAMAGASGILVAAYVIRGAADTASQWSWVAWLSPLGWVERIHPLGERSVAPFFAALGLAVVGVVLAAGIAARRDLGAGLIRPRPGPSTARWPVTTLTVTVRTLGSAVVPWMSAAFGYCLLVGLLLTSVDSLVGSGGTSDLVKELGGGEQLGAALIATVLGILAIAAAAVAVSVAGSMRGDDRAGRSEILLATAVSPAGRYAATGALAAGAVVAVSVLAGLGVVVGGLIVRASGSSIGEIMLASLVGIPASLAVGSVAFAAYGIGARWLAIGWCAVVADLLLGPLGTLVGAPGWLRDVAPHTHLPATVGAGVPVLPTVVFLAVAVALVGVGALGLRRRDAL